MLSVQDQEKAIYLLTGIIPDHKRHKFKNPFRIDHTPGCYFDYKFDKKNILMCDWADKRFHCINVLDIVNIKIHGKRITTHQESQEAKNYLENLLQKPIPTWQYEKQNKEYQINVKVTPRPMEPRDIIYWGQYGITEENLKQDNVFPINQYIMDYGKTFVTYYVHDILAYAIEMKSGTIKIYKPQESKNKKWDGYVTHNDLYLEPETPCNGRIYWVEGYKDARSVKNAGFNGVGLQSSTTLPDISGLNKWKNAEHIFMLDPDKSGLINSINHAQKLKSMGFDAGYAQYPLKYQRYGDVSDIRKKLGQTACIDCINSLYLYKTLET